jgi:phosphoesterase RecJ-like protein
VTSATAPTQVADAFRAASRITAICHENPDADTLGAAIAVAIIAERLGKASEVVSVDRPAPAFDFLPRIERVTRRPQLEPDLAVICDAASMERAGRIVVDEAAWFEHARLANIDHHVSNTSFGDVQLVDATASATCEVVLRLADELGVRLDPDLATALLTGIVRDTQGFGDPSTSPDTLRAVARLAEAGAPLASIQRHVLGDIPFATMSLWGRMLEAVGQRQDGRIVYTQLTQSMLDETGTQQHDADGIVELIATAKGAQVTLLLRELGPTTTRISIRTTDAVDATAIAGAFGGGGHARRAGCTVRAPLEAAVTSVLAAAAQRLPDRPA